MQQVIRLIPGVLGVRVAMAEGRVSEVHVLVNSDRHPVQIVRDVESTFAAHAGLRVDRRVISVAQVGPTPTDPPRLILDTVQLKLRDDITDVQVELLHQNQRYVGNETGPSTRTQRARSVAHATLIAAAGTLGGSVKLFLDDVRIVALDHGEAVVATVGVHDGNREEMLVGCAFVRRDDAQSAARATLSALNRRFSGLLDTAIRA